MVRLDDRQQRLAYIGAAVAAVGFVAAQAGGFPDTITYAVLGLAMAALLAFGARRRSVVLTGAAAFAVSFGPWGTVLWFLGAAYIAFGGLLMYRASKAAAAEAGPRPPRPSRASRPSRQRKVREEPVAQKKPARSKRYTPPKR